jgi:hypothetical protein
MMCRVKEDVSIFVYYKLCTTIPTISFTVVKITSNLGWKMTTPTCRRKTYVDLLHKTSVVQISFDFSLQRCAQCWTWS